MAAPVNLAVTTCPKQLLGFNVGGKKACNSHNRNVYGQVLTKEALRQAGVMSFPVHERYLLPPHQVVPYPQSKCLPSEQQETLYSAGNMSTETGRHRVPGSTHKSASSASLPHLFFFFFFFFFFFIITLFGCFSPTTLLLVSKIKHTTRPR